jgi:hypothetical protein
VRAREEEQTQRDINQIFFKTQRTNQQTRYQHHMHQPEISTWEEDDANTTSEISEQQQEYKISPRYHHDDSNNTTRDITHPQATQACVRLGLTARRKWRGRGGTSMSAIPKVVLARVLVLGELVSAR